MREKPRAILDTNLFVSAFISPTGTPNQLITLWEQRNIILLTSAALIDEVDRVLHRASIKEKYQLSEERIERLLTRLHLTAEWVMPLASLPLHSRDPKDDHLLACALGGGADFLITGDNDLLVLDTDPALEQLQIVTAQAFLQRMRDTS
jgi:putative PIN family toxin of toxin-antitoxin system